MNEYQRQRAIELFSRCERVILATCGPAGPQVSQVASQICNEQLILFLDRTSDELFNLEMQPELTVLTLECELHGTGTILPESVELPLEPWQAAVQIQPVRLHVLDRHSMKRVETIDF